MKKFEITYKNLNVMFGDNTFTKVLEGKTPDEALTNYGLKEGYILKMIEAREV